MVIVVWHVIVRLVVLWMPPLPDDGGVPRLIYE